MDEKISQIELLSLTTDIVSSYVSNNTLSPIEISDIVERVYKTLANVGADAALLPDLPQPAVPVNKSVMPDYLVCLEDGKKLKMLKRHLKTAYDMSPEDYKERWGLPLDYPMVAPNYAKKRSQLAKDSGLGTRPR